MEVTETDCLLSVLVGCKNIKNTTDWATEPNVVKASDIEFCNIFHIEKAA